MDKIVLMVKVWGIFCQVLHRRALTFAFSLLVFSATLLPYMYHDFLFEVNLEETSNLDEVMFIWAVCCTLYVDYSFSNVWCIYAINKYLPCSEFWGYQSGGDGQGSYIFGAGPLGCNWPGASSPVTVIQIKTSDGDWEGRVKGDTWYLRNGEGDLFLMG